MKRYRIVSFDLDARARWLTQKIDNNWNEQVKEQHRAAGQKTVEGLIHEYGARNAEVKIQDFVALGPKPLSILSYHNRFATQSRTAFVAGAYYPALTAACALGERILNHLILILRDDFVHTREFKAVARVKAIQDWPRAIKTLNAWGVLESDVEAAYWELHHARNRALHYNPVTDKHDRELALEAIGLLDRIIEGQFGSFGPHRWFIPDIAGASFLKQSTEYDSFINKIYHPKSFLVGPNHYLEFTDRGFLVLDPHKYEIREISDEEFAHLYEEATQKRLAAHQSGEDRIPGP